MFYELGDSKDNVVKLEVFDFIAKVIGGENVKIVMYPKSPCKRWDTC